MASSKHNLTWIIVLLGSLCVVTPFAIDMYLPAFARIAAEFGTTTSAISLSLSTYFVGFALGQLIYGPMLDRFGRKKPLYVGLVVYILCSVGCALAPNLRTFIALRFLEALGGCVAQVGAIAMVRDFFPAKESAKIFSLLFLMIGTSPLLAPTIGSAMMAGLGWHWIFVLLAAIAFVILVVTFFFLPEGHRPDHSVSLRPGPIFFGFWNIFRNPQFLTYTLAGAFSFAGLFTFVAGSPVIFMDGFHMGTKAFGITFAVLVMGFIGGNNVNVFLLRRYSSQGIFLAALVMQVFIGVGFVLGARAHVVDLKGTLALFFVFLACIGFTYPNGAAIALGPFSRDAGRASALMGFLQTGIGALISMGIGLLGVQAVITLMAGTALVALVTLLVGRTRVGELVINDEREVFVAH
ncbi:DHA1 family bicyclomycin/chloramphenicol resistance-like MFS transporter [Silvibacterium bohemicum]|uniref:DHA1 family bicyclomycin/chloramphenicol resistance-like MFS transporter n=1 Tax=Silvibacterium bohemicum TaxID=1577686 RepID=A0A841K148_9BACT|nr:multidrug effflux MFS transporter [Silvibacterium bohemicum]MBB6144921.1 DHA1 family bicyclomycin/chloramphenicol resistance-like MFS transporter [Silvibacterium bohemicum]